MMDRRFSANAFIAISVAILLCLTFSCESRTEQKPAVPTEEPVKVKIGYLNIVASLPLFVAEEKGFFVEEGIEFETIAIATSNQLVDGIIADNLDCFIESSAVPVLAVELQSPGKLKVFAASEITPETPFDALLVKEGSAIKSLSDLAGKKIGVFPGSTATNLLKKYLSDKGVDISKTLFLPTPPPNLLTALIKGSVDVIHPYEPTTAIALSKGGVVKLHGSVYAEMLSPNPQGVSVVSTLFIKKHPKTARKVIRAFERAMAFMKENDAEARQILIKRMKLSEEVANKCVFLYFLPHEKIDVGIFQRYSDMLTALGELSGQVKVEGLVYRN